MPKIYIVPVSGKILEVEFTDTNDVAGFERAKAMAGIDYATRVNVPAGSCVLLVEEDGLRMEMRPNEHIAAMFPELSIHNNGLGIVGPALIHGLGKTYKIDPKIQEYLDGH